MDWMDADILTNIEKNDGIIIKSQTCIRRALLKPHWQNK